MKSPLATLFTIFTFAIIACGPSDESTSINLPVPMVQEEVVEETTESQPQVSLVTTSTNFAPDFGGISGNIGYFQNVNSLAYQINLSNSEVETFVSHDEGRVMIRLNFEAFDLEDMFNNSIQEFSIGSSDEDISALACQGNTLDGMYEYDSFPNEGHLSVTPISNGWVIDYWMLLPEGGEIEGYVGIVQ